MISLRYPPVKVPGRVRPRYFALLSGHHWGRDDPVVPALLEREGGVVDDGADGRLAVLLLRDELCHLRDDGRTAIRLELEFQIFERHLVVEEALEGALKRLLVCP